MDRSRFAIPAIKAFVAVFILSLAPSIAGAACHVVTPSGSGAKTGADWNNAYADLPSKLVRGDSYYVATGNYGSIQTFGEADSGTAMITVKKASPTDNCTSVGWNSAYGVGQAIYNSFQINTDYITIDGNYNTGAAGSYGILANLGGGQGEVINWGTSSNTIIRNVEMQGPGIGYVYSTEGRAINMESGTTTNVLISHCSMHDLETIVSIFNASNVTIEYSNLYNSDDGNTAAYHPNVYQAGWDGPLTFRFNTVTAWTNEGIMLWGGTVGPMYIYGNIWHDSVPGRYARVLEVQNVPQGPIYFFNNTIVNSWCPITGAVSGGSFISGSLGEDNIYWNTQSCANYMPAETDSIEQTGNPSPKPFNNYAAEDYTLTSSSSARGTGGNLASYCSGLVTSICQDILGDPRPSVGAWDQGAYEFGTSASVNPPTNLQVISVQ